jgi:hypothetical protein
MGMVNYVTEIHIILPFVIMAFHPVLDGSLFLLVVFNGTSSTIHQ